MKSGPIIVLLVAAIIGFSIWLMWPSKTPEVPKTTPKDTEPKAKVQPRTLPEKKPIIPPAKNPFARPNAAPKGLVNVFKEDAKLGMKMDELQAIAKKQANQEISKSLRWLIHESRTSEVLRNEAAKALLAWNDPDLSSDLAKMMRDPGHTDTWREYCVQFLEQHFLKHGDERSLKEVESSASLKNAKVRCQGLFSLANISKERKWAEAEVASQETLSKLIKTALVSDERQEVITALRSIARAEMIEFTADVEQIASDKGQRIDARVAAVQALGQVGRPESKAVLEACAKEKHARLNRFAKISLKLLETKH